MTDRFPENWDFKADGYLASQDMPDGRKWCLMPLFGGRLRIVIAEDRFSAGEHWCYSNVVEAMLSYGRGPDVPPTGWSRHMRPDGVFERPREDGTIRVGDEWP